MRSFRASRLAALSLGLAFSLTTVAQNSTPRPRAQDSHPSPSNPAPEAQQNRAQGQGTSVDDELQLTQDQKEKIAAVVDDENKQIGAVREDTSLTLEQKQQKALQIRQAGVPKIKAVLTPEQLQKLAVIQERNRQQQVSPPQPPQR